MTTDYSQLLNPAAVNAALIAGLRAAYQEAGGLEAAFRTASANPAWSPVTATYISDNGGYADLAKAEIQARLRNIDVILATVSGKAPTQNEYHDIPAQDWRAGALDLAQLARDTVRGPGNAIFINCAPRLKQRGINGNNGGEDVYVGQLENGTVVSGVSEHSFAFFRDLVVEGRLELYRVNVQTEGSQFRSRDFFPWFSKLLAHNLAQQATGWRENLSVAERRDFLARLNFIDTTYTVPAAHIPDLTQEPTVVRVDTHGNLKLSISRSDVRPEWLDTPLIIHIQGERIEALIRSNMFDAGSGQQGIAPGSSGHWPDSPKGDPRFLEISTIGSSLRDRLKISDQDLKQGVEVIIQPAPLSAQDNRPVAAALTAGLPVPVRT